MFEIIKGHDPSSYFWIMPVKVRDITQKIYNSEDVDEMRECEISIEEDDIFYFLYHFKKNILMKVCLKINQDMMLMALNGI